MSARRPLVIALAVLCGLPTAFAQEEDLLAPLTPEEPQPKAKKKKPAAKKPRPKPSDDDLLVAPLSISTELQISVGGGVEGAVLVLDGKELGAITGAPVEVAPGAHEVTVRRPGFADRTVKVRVDEGEREVLKVDLVPTAAVVAITSNVEDARVKVDGKDVGHPPVRGLLLAPGDHEIWVEHEDYLPEVAKLTVKAGKDYTVDAPLEPVNASVAKRPKLTPSDTVASRPSPLTEQPAAGVTKTAGTPWYGRWYVWAGAAAVVAAAAGGTYAAMNSHPSLTPTQVCGGVQCDATINGLRIPVGAGQF